jgi:hypothetical protein
MSSKRHQRRRSCECKQRYEKATAVSVAQDMRRRGKMVSAYSCHFCGGWHVGRLNKTARHALAGRLHNNAMA